MKYIIALIIIGILLLIACSPSPKVSNNYDVKAAEARIAQVTSEVGDTIKKIEKSEAEWKAELSEMEFYVLRKAGTERSFSGDLWDNKKEGVYVCAGCQLPLFDSSTKYKSGTGWPSFWDSIKANHIETTTDYNIGYARTEVHCARCGGHQGHVFKDGPQPTGLRYCINSVSLDFVEKKEDTMK
ncbi:MAG: peptide-methionine (R)-S-oxide reductase MsrB [Bacteroidota bacterium]